MCHPLLISSLVSPGMIWLLPDLSGVQRRQRSSGPHLNPLKGKNRVRVEPPYSRHTGTFITVLSTVLILEIDRIIVGKETCQVSTSRRVSFMDGSTDKLIQ